MTQMRSQQPDPESLSPLPQRDRDRSQGRSIRYYIWNHWKLEEFIAVSLFSRIQSLTSRTQGQRSRFETKRKSESTSMEKDMTEAQDCLLRETRRQVKKETKILDKARSALIH